MNKLDLDEIERVCKAVEQETHFPIPKDVSADRRWLWLVAHQWLPVLTAELREMTNRAEKAEAELQKVQDILAEEMQWNSW